MVYVFLCLTSDTGSDATHGLTVLATLLVRDWLVFNQPKTKSCLSLLSDATNGLTTDYCLLRTDT